MSNLQIKRGLKTNLPTLVQGEFGYCTDTNELYIGNGSNKQIILKQQLDEVDNMELEYLKVGKSSDGYWKLSNNSSNLKVENLNDSNNSNYVELTTGYLQLPKLKFSEGLGILNSVIYLSTTKDFGTINANSETTVTITKNNNNCNYCNVNIPALPQGLGIMNTYVINDSTIGIKIRNFTNQNITTGSLSVKGILVKLS